MGAGGSCRQAALVVTGGSLSAQLLSATYSGHTPFTTLFVCDVPVA